MIDYNQQLSEHFTLAEFVKSSTAKKLGIDNTPTLLAISHLRELCTNLLEPFRQWYGKPVIISSGYRCPRLNTAVGGVPQSAHQYGFGADIMPKTGTLEEFALKWKEFLETHPNIKWDQLIKEKAKKSEWLHVAIKNGAGKQRSMIFELKDFKAKPDDKNGKGSN